MARYKSSRNVIASPPRRCGAVLRLSQEKEKWEDMAHSTLVSSKRARRELVEISRRPDDWHDGTLRPVKAQDTDVRNGSCVNIGVDGLGCTRVTYAR